jgi:DNA replication protein DnaC
MHSNFLPEDTTMAEPTPRDLDKMLAEKRDRLRPMIPINPANLGEVQQQLEKRFEDPATKQAIAAAERKHAEQVAQSRLQEKQANATTLWRERGSRYHRCSLTNFEITDKARQTPILTALARYESAIRAMIDDGVGLVFTGPPGSGKDHLMAAMMNAALLNSYRVRWTSGVKFFSALRDSIGGEDKEGGVLGPLVVADVLAISDPVPPFGSLSEFQAAKLFEVIDERYNNRRATWVTINAANREEASQRIGHATIDRLRDGAVCVACNWDSYRKTREL